MRSLTSFGTLARTVSNLLKEPDLPGLQDIFTEPSHTEEKIHFKPLSLFTKKLKAFLRGVSCVPSPFDADADSDTEQPDAVFVTLCVSVWCSLILCDLLGVIV